MHSNLEARERRPVRLGVAGAVLAFLALTGLQALAVRPYLPPDEVYHVGYAAMVLDGQLPTLTTSLPAEEVPLAPTDGQPRRVYVANHPPLFYVVTAVPLGVSRLLNAPAAGFLAARLVSASLAAAGVALVAWLAVLLVPGRPRVAVGAAWLAALLPSLPHVSAFVYNDGLGFLAATATLVAAVAMLRRGLSLPRLAGLTAASAAAALTRAPGPPAARRSGSTCATGRCTAPSPAPPTTSSCSGSSRRTTCSSCCGRRRTCCGYMTASGCGPASACSGCRRCRSWSRCPDSSLWPPSPA